jgi:hypothetical protein
MNPRQSLDINKEMNKEARTNYEQSAKGSDIFSALMNPESQENGNTSTQEANP